MATYNGEKYLKKQIDSIIPQLTENDEIIISDDGSTDATCSIIQTYNDERIKLIKNDNYHGYVGNFENALRASSGDCIFLCDQDDIWKPNKIKVIMKYLKKYDLVTHNAELINETGNSLGKTYFDCMHRKKGFIANFLSTRHLGCCMAFNRKVLNTALPFVSYKRGHDYWIGCIAELKYKVIFIDDILICYRRHGNNASTSSLKSSNSFVQKLYKRLDMAQSLFKRVIQKKYEQNKTNNRSI